MFYQASDVVIDVIHTYLGAPLPAISRATYTLYNKLTGDVITRRTLIDGGVTFSAGIVTIALTESDTALAVGSLYHDCVVRLTDNDADVFILSEKIKFNPTLSRIL